MAEQMRTAPCEVCGRDWTARRHRTPKRRARPWRCITCQAQAQAQANLEMANKSGPAWDAWVAGMREVVGA